MSGVVIVKTGTANLASVISAVERLGVQPVITTDAAHIADADRLILPGVGTLAAAMASLHEQRLVQVLTDRITDGRPALAICLGLQLLLEGSEESPGVPALNIAPGIATRFADVRTPHMGWAYTSPLLREGAGGKVCGADAARHFAQDSLQQMATPDPSVGMPYQPSPLPPPAGRGGFAYFAHSYRLTQAPPGWSVSWADHGGRFVASMSRGRVLACQFHPELSGPWGAALFRGWLTQREAN